MANAIPRILSVAVTGPDSIGIVWPDREDRAINLAGWVHTGSDVLAPLRSPAVFATARLGDGGRSVEWGADEDLAIDAYHLRLIADEQMPFGNQEAVRWQAAAGLSNAEAASFLGIALSTWHGYKGRAAIPAHVGMVCRAALRDPLILHAHHRPRTAGRPRKVLRPNSQKCPA